MMKNSKVSSTCSPGQKKEKKKRQKFVSTLHEGECDRVAIMVQFSVSKFPMSRAIVRPRSAVRASS
jgi:hypothetical protein